MPLLCYENSAVIIRWNLPEPVPDPNEIHAPAGRSWHLVAMLVVEPAGTCAGTCPECVHLYCASAPPLVMLMMALAGTYA